MIALEVIANILHFHPLYSRFGIYVLDQPVEIQSDIIYTSIPKTSIYLPFKHQNHMRMTPNVRMYRDREAKFLFLAVKVVKVIPPQIFYVSRVHPSMGVWRLLDEHHRWQIVKVPIGWNLHKAGLCASFERMHPMGWVFLIVDRCPRIAGAKPVGVAVLVRERMVWIKHTFQPTLLRWGSEATSYHTRSHISTSTLPLLCLPPTKAQHFPLAASHRTP